MKKIVILILVLVVSLFAVDINRLLEAQKEANISYAHTHNVYPSIELLQNADIKKIINKKPKNISKQRYSKLMFEYAKFLYHTVDDTWRHINQQKVQKILLKIKKYRPRDSKLQLLLAGSYLRYFKFSVRTRLGWGFDGNPHDESWEWELPHLMKKAYVDYVKLCKNQNIKPKLTQKEWLIVNRKRLFIEYYSTFTGKIPYYSDLYDERTKYKKGFENICSEYISLLNKMPDDKYMQCSRYSIEKDSLFTIDPPVTEGRRKVIYGYGVKYKNTEFNDNHSHLQLRGLDYGGSQGTEKHICFYQFVNFIIKRQKRCHISSECEQVNKHYIKNKDK